MRWDREKLPKTDSHVYGENGAEIMVYNMKRNPKKREGKKNREKEKFRKYTRKRKSSRLLIILFSLSRGWIFVFFTYNSSS